MCPASFAPGVPVDRGGPEKVRNQRERFIMGRHWDAVFGVRKNVITSVSVENPDGSTAKAVTLAVGATGLTLAELADAVEESRKAVRSGEAEAVAEEVSHATEVTLADGRIVKPKNKLNENATVDQVALCIAEFIGADTDSMEAAVLADEVKDAQKEADRVKRQKEADALKAKIRELETGEKPAPLAPVPTAVADRAAGSNPEVKGKAHTNGKS
jgi:hypothetical protein